MAEDTNVKLDSSRSCCALLKVKYSKLEHKRNALRKAVNLLEQQFSKLQTDNLTIKKRYEEERARAELEIEAKSKESALRVGLENDISKLKSELASFQESRSSSNQDGEVLLLRTRVSEGEAEINQLKGLLEKERRRGESEKKKAEVEKNKAAEAWKMVKFEKNKAEEERARAELEIEAKSKESALRVGLENEISKLKSELASFQEGRGSGNQDGNDEVILLHARVSEGEEEINKLKELLEKERRVESEKKKAEAEKKKAEAEKKKAVEAQKMLKFEKNKAEEERRVADVERSLAKEFRLRSEASEAEINRLTELLEKEMKKEALEKERAEAEKKKAAEAWQLVKSEKRKAEVERKAADIQRSRAEECRLSLEACQTEAKEMRTELVLEKSKTAEALRRLEEEKGKANREQERAESEMAKAEEQRKCADEEKNKLMDEKTHSYDLSRQLEEEIQRNKALEKKVQEIMMDKKMENVHGLPFDAGGHAANAHIMALKKQLKLEKLHVKHCKRVANFEKLRNNLLEKEVYSIKQDFVRFAGRLNILDTYFSLDREGTDVPAKFGNSLELHSSNSNGKLSGVSARNNSQSSAMFSASTSLSDGPLVGSQEKNAFTVTSPSKLREDLRKGSTMARLSGEMIPRIGKNLSVVTENKVRNVIHGFVESPSSDPNGHDSNGVVGAEPIDSRKRKQLEDALQSTQLSSEVGRSHTQVKELSVLHEGLVEKGEPPGICSESDLRLNSLGDGRCAVASLLDDLYATQYKSSKKRKVPQENPSGEVWNKGEVEQSDNLPTEVSKNGRVLNQAVPLCEYALETVEACRDETAVDSDEETSRFLEKMMSDDYMKLLDLDNSDEEQLYRMAMEAPLSPSLPEIEMPNIEAIEMDGSINMREEGLQRRVENEKDLVPPCIFNIIEVQLGSDGSVNPSEGLSIAEDGFGIATDIGNTSQHQVFEGTMEVLCTSSGGSKDDRVSRYFLVFPNTEDKSSIARIVSACETCISRSCVISQKVCMVDKILPALAQEKNLLPEENACVLFCLLMHNFSEVTSKSSASDFTFCPYFDLTHMTTVMSYVEANRVLIESCQLDTLLRLIEDFLIDRRVFVYNEVSHDQQISCDSWSTIIVNGTTVNMSSKPASVDQLVSGSIILASICATTGHIGFICEATYNILRLHRSDSQLVLKMLHVFASICGSEYFKLSNYCLIMTVVKSLVTLLERGHVMAGVPCTSYISSASESQLTFPKCPHCLFSEGVVPVDEVVKLLLEKLQNHAVPRTGCQPILLLDSSSFNASPVVEGAPVNADHEMGLGELDMDVDVSCFICKHGTFPTSQYTSVDGKTLNHFSDMLSLVELVACYMKWDWTRTKVIPHLLNMLELCVSEKFTTAIVTLLGQLGRSGIDDSGYEHLGVEELRCSLSAFLGQESTRKWCLSAEYAVVHALVGLRSVDLSKLVKSNKELPADTRRSLNANLIELWFSRLTEEEKSLFFDIFPSDEVH